MRAHLFGVSPFDPMVLAGTAAVLALAALLASWLPARRAARIRPVEAMAAE
jgi:ABC-type lipoprotein release transport system permease subunit